MAGCGWSWVVVAKFWLIVGCGSKIMAGRGWSWAVATKLWLVMGVRGLIVDGRGWSLDLVMPQIIHQPSGYFHS